MPMTYEIDAGRKLVLAEGTGTLSMADVFAYHKEVWSRSDVIGFDEIVDFRQVTDTIQASGSELIELAKMASAKDADTGSAKLAIVAKADLPFGLGRMYQAYRESAGSSHKKVGVFCTREEAETWIGR